MSFGTMPLTPAYGRDYKSKDAVLLDWYAGKDFRTSAGPYTSREDFPAGTQVTVRYGKLRKVMVFTSQG